MTLRVYQVLFLRESNSQLILLYHFLLSLREYCFLQSLLQILQEETLVDIALNYVLIFYPISTCKYSPVSIKLIEHCFYSSYVCQLNGASDRLLHAVLPMETNILILNDIIQLWVGNDRLVGSSGDY